MDDSVSMLFMDSVLSCMDMAGGMVVSSRVPHGHLMPAMHGSAFRCSEGIQVASSNCPCTLVTFVPLASALPSILPPSPLPPSPASSQGVEPGYTFSGLGVPGDWYGALEWVFPTWARAHALDKGEAVNILKGAIVTADRVVTVSPVSTALHCTVSPVSTALHCQPGEHCTALAGR